MTEQEIRVAKSIKNGILPELQEIQRDLYMDDHITVSIEPGTFKKCMNVFVRIQKSTDGSSSGNILCLGIFSFTTFHLDECEQRIRNAKALRGVRWFIKNWQKRLSA
jgi:hypothetical protein